jgi:hypothetical protein
MNPIKYILAAGAAAAMCALAGAYILYNNTVAGYLSLLIAIARTHHPTISGWAPFLFTLLGAMICPRKHILTRYRTIACTVWTIIAVILAVLGHRLGQTNIVGNFLVGLEHPEVKPISDWMQSNDWLQSLMILAPVGPVFLWIIIMIQVIAGSSVMKLIRNLGIPPLILKLALITAIAGTSYWLGLRKGTDDVTEAWNQEKSIHVGTEIEWTLHKPYSSEIIGYKEGQVIHTNPNHDFLSQFDIDVQWDRSDKPESVHTNLSGEPTPAPGNVEHITAGDLSNALVMNLARYRNQRYWHGSWGGPPRPDLELLRKGIKSIGHLIELVQAAKDLKVDPYAYNGAAQEESINTVQAKALWPEGKQFDWNMTMSDWWLFVQAQYHWQWSSGGRYKPLAYAIGNELKHYYETIGPMSQYDYLKDEIERVSCASDYDFVLNGLSSARSELIGKYKCYVPNCIESELVSAN